MVPVLELCGGEVGVLGSEGRLPEPACPQELWGKASLAAEKREASGGSRAESRGAGEQVQASGGEASRGRVCFAGAESVSQGLSGGLLGLPFTSAQNKAALCQKRAFPQPHGRPRSPDLAPSSLRPGNPGPHHSPSPGSGVGVAAPRLGGVRCPALASRPPSSPLGEDSGSPAPQACRVG